MVTIKEMRAYKNTTEFQDFLLKFHQDKEFQKILKATNTIYRDDDDIMMDKILTDDINLSSLSLDDIHYNVQHHTELFFRYYKRFLCLYVDEDLVNEIDEDDDYEPEEDDDEENVIYPKVINSYTLLHCMIDFHLLNTNQKALFEYHKKLKIPNAKKHSKNLVDLFNAL